MADEAEVNRQNGTESQEKKLTDSERVELLTQEFLKDLNENPKYKSFFEQYNGMSIENFKNYYSKEKAYIIVNSQYYVEKEEEHISLFSDLAWRMLWEIQQRKLFDIQCYWRAEQIKIPEIETTCDFEYWSLNISECPFLSPISQEEFDRYIAYVEDTSYEDIKTFPIYYKTEWQEYDDFRENHFQVEQNTIYPTPEWYLYYESVTGLSSLYELPDIKGEKEEKYLDAVRKKNSKEYEEQNKNKPKIEIDKRPHLYFYESKERDKFLKMFESHMVQYKFDCYNKWRDIYDDSELEDAVETLTLADRPIHLKSDVEWRQSIIDASNNYIKQRILEAFPGVYKNYLFRINNMLGFGKKKERNSSDMKWNFKRDMILNGREILGEPRDFNY